MVLNVLIACEESQAVCKEFRKLGHNAFSCDVQECSGGHPEWHIQGDALAVINGDCAFVTADAHTHTQAGEWDILIAHPPCTYLSNAGAARLYRNDHDGEYQMVNIERLKKGILGRDFFMAMLNARCEHIAVENPVPSSIYNMPEKTQMIEPWMFGHPFTKKTYLWLKGLPQLRPTEIVEERNPYICGNSEIWKKQAAAGKVWGKEKSAKHRSKTFSGIAKAMAEQWSQYVESGGLYDVVDDYDQLKLF